jgi:choline dehydrogenase
MNRERRRHSTGSTHDCLTATLRAPAASEIHTAIMYDFVIVGAGSAGCVLANRLSAGGHTVALLEVGPPANHRWRVRAPAEHLDLWRSSLDWGFATTPQPDVDEREVYWPRGKLLGGSSCLNAMVYIRGNRANYDEWRELGNPGWGYADVLPYFKRSENNPRGPSEYHGWGGPLAVEDTPTSRASRAFVDAAAARCGIGINPDFNGAEQAGAGLYQHTVRDGERWDTATAFLDPVRGRANLTVITGALVTGVVVDGDRVTGVRARIGGAERVIFARETILAAGAIGSPQLLMLSGIGAPDELRAAGVEPRHALPGVGKHLQDHPDIYLVYQATADSGAPTLSRPRFISWAVKYLLGRGGPLAVSPAEAGAFVRARSDAVLPDTQLYCVPYGLPAPNLDRARGFFTGRHVTLLTSLLYARSVGELRLRSPDPTAAPIIDPRYLRAPEDLEHLVAGARLIREIAATAPLAGLLGAEVWPGASQDSAEALRAYIRRNLGTTYHASGTCRMGVDPDAVVDPELRVHGLRGLRVADASIMPRLIGGNTNAPTIMIAEKAADLVLGRGCAEPV